jgi:hypothetical protein
MKKLIVIVILTCALSGYAQKIYLKQGSLKPLKGEKAMRLEFSYDNMMVGDFPENDYVTKNREELNTKDPGRGTIWETKWYGDRKERFEPKFILLFSKYSRLMLSEDAKHTMIVHTTGTEPGWLASGIIRSDAKVNLEILIVETANRENVIARMVMKDIPGRGAIGLDYDAGLRIQEAYAKAGKALGKVLHDKIH